MKKYKKPVLNVEQFTANEFIATCGDSGTVYKFECNAGKKNHQYAVKDSKGNVVRISGMTMDGRRHYYYPCGDTHEADSNSEFITGYHIDDASTPWDENISVIVWTENNTNVHCTTNLNMSTWETAKS